MHPLKGLVQGRVGVGEGEHRFKLLTYKQSFRNKYKKSNPKRYWKQSNERRDIRDVNRNEKAFNVYTGSGSNEKFFRKFLGENQNKNGKYLEFQVFFSNTGTNFL